MVAFVVGLLSVPFLVRRPVHAAVGLGCWRPCHPSRRRLPRARSSGWRSFVASAPPSPWPPSGRGAPGAGVVAAGGRPAFVWWAVLVVVAYGLLIGWGAYVQARRALLWSLRERAQQAEATQAQRVAEARRLERHRIAREMHDVLAHRLSLVSTYAGALEYRPDSSPERIAAAAGVVRAGVHQALDELREVILVLRDEDDGDPTGQAAADARRTCPASWRRAGPSVCASSWSAPLTTRPFLDDRAGGVPGGSGGLDQCPSARARPAGPGGGDGATRCGRRGPGDQPGRPRTTGGADGCGDGTGRPDRAGRPAGRHAHTRPAGRDVRAVRAVTVGERESRDHTCSRPVGRGGAGAARRRRRPRPGRAHDDGRRCRGDPGRGGGRGRRRGARRGRGALPRRGADGPPHAEGRRDHRDPAAAGPRGARRTSSC